MAFLPTSNLLTWDSSLCPLPGPPLGCQVPLECNGGGLLKRQVAGLRNFVKEKVSWERAGLTWLEFRCFRAFPVLDVNSRYHKSSRELVLYDLGIRLSGAFWQEELLHLRHGASTHQAVVPRFVTGLIASFGP